MRPAIPLTIELTKYFSHEDDQVSETLQEISHAFEDVVIDAERGKSEILAHRDKMLSVGISEYFSERLLKASDQTYFVTIRWKSWPNNSVNALVIDSSGFFGGDWIISEIS